jgi:hypothetical protein
LSILDKIREDIDINHLIFKKIEDLNTSINLKMAYYAKKLWENSIDTDTALDKLYNKYLQLYKKETR